MSTAVDVIEAQALSLPQADRSRLVERLIASLGHDAQWEEAWADEADRREAKIQSGLGQWVDGPEVLTRIRETLK